MPAKKNPKQSKDKLPESDNRDNESINDEEGEEEEEETPTISPKIKKKGSGSKTAAKLDEIRSQLIYYDENDESKYLPYIRTNNEYRFQQEELLNEYINRRRLNEDVEQIRREMGPRLEELVKKNDNKTGLQDWKLLPRNLLLKGALKGWETKKKQRQTEWREMKKELGVAVSKELRPNPLGREVAGNPDNLARTSGLRSESNRQSSAAEAIARVVERGQKDEKFKALDKPEEGYKRVHSAQTFYTEKNPPPQNPQQERSLQSEADAILTRRRLKETLSGQRSRQQRSSLGSSQEVPLPHVTADSDPQEQPAQNEGRTATLRRQRGTSSLKETRQQKEQPAQNETKTGTLKRQKGTSSLKDTLQQKDLPVENEGRTATLRRQKGTSSLKETPQQKEQPAQNETKTGTLKRQKGTSSLKETLQQQEQPAQIGSQYEERQQGTLRRQTGTSKLNEHSDQTTSGNRSPSIMDDPRNYESVSSFPALDPEQGPSTRDPNLVRTGNVPSHSPQVTMRAVPMPSSTTSGRRRRRSEISNTSQDDTHRRGKTPRQDDKSTTPSPMSTTESREKSGNGSIRSRHQSEGSNKSKSNTPSPMSTSTNESNDSHRRRQKEKEHIETDDYDLPELPMSQTGQTTVSQRPPSRSPDTGIEWFSDLMSPTYTGNTSPGSFDIYDDLLGDEGAERLIKSKKLSPNISPHRSPNHATAVTRSPLNEEQMNTASPARQAVSPRPRSVTKTPSPTAKSPCCSEKSTPDNSSDFTYGTHPHEIKNIREKLGDGNTWDDCTEEHAIETIRGIGDRIFGLSNTWVLKLTESSTLKEQSVEIVDHIEKITAVNNRQNTFELNGHNMLLLDATNSVLIEDIFNLFSSNTRHPEKEGTKIPINMTTIARDLVSKWMDTLKNGVRIPSLVSSTLYKDASRLRQDGIHIDPSVIPAGVATMMFIEFTSDKPLKRDWITTKHGKFVTYGEALGLLPNNRIGKNLMAVLFELLIRERNESTDNNDLIGFISWNDMQEVLKGDEFAEDMFRELVKTHGSCNRILTYILRPTEKGEVYILDFIKAEKKIGIYNPCQSQDSFRVWSAGNIHRQDAAKQIIKVTQTVKRMFGENGGWGVDVNTEFPLEETFERSESIPIPASSKHHPLVALFYLKKKMTIGSGVEDVHHLNNLDEITNEKDFRYHLHKLLTESRRI